MSEDTFVAFEVCVTLRRLWGGQKGLPHCIGQSGLKFPVGIRLGHCSNKKSMCDGGIYI